MRQRQTPTALLYVVLVVLVFAHQLQGHGALSSEGMLALELHAQGHAEPWALGEKLPYTYRPLFRSLVLGVYGSFPAPAQHFGNFFKLFVVASALSLLAAVGAFHWLMREMGFDRAEARLGGILFLLGFPILFSHDMPIHTREDLLGYAWIALTLIAVVRDNPWAVAALGVVGAGVRETCLLGVLPYFLVSQRPGWVKALVYAVPGAAWLLLRRLRNPTGESYAYFGVSLAPLREYPAEALIYAFAAFGVVWVAAGLRLADRETPPRHPLLAPRVVGLALAAVVLTGWTMGMIREARITYVLFPFLIPPAVELLRSERAKELAQVRIAQVAAGGVVVLGLLALLLIAQDPLTRLGWYDPMSDTLTPPDGLRSVIGTSFNVGVSPSVGVEGKTITNAFASPANGPHVLLNLAASVLLLVGFFQRRAEARERASAKAEAA